ncbi:MAG TPA: glycosyltransferase [Longimicrobiaceae bacterium]|nr:glycosyltransferase [Longimicrobiaceae bacterium]
MHKSVMHSQRPLDFKKLLGNSLDLIAAHDPIVRQVETDPFGLPSGYKSRLDPKYFEDSGEVRGGVTWQRDVYRTAFRLARSLGLKRVIDVGCGNAEKLIETCGEFETIGIDFRENLLQCREAYPQRTWIELDLETEDSDELTSEMLSDSVIVVSDVIEHLKDPTALVNRLRRWLDHSPVAVLSTPDRARIPGASVIGPPNNPSHVREWSLDELIGYLSSSELRVLRTGHVRSNSVEPDFATSVVVLVGGDAENRRFVSDELDRKSSKTPGYSFGIITNGRDPEQLKRTIESIRGMAAGTMEIILVGEVPVGISRTGVRIVPMEQAARAGRLGEMRNCVADEAQYSTLIISDDDIEFSPDFVEAIEKHGSFDVLAASVANPDGTRFWDWAEHGGQRGHCLMDPGEVSSFAYVTGGLIIVRDYVLRNVRWDSKRAMYEEEDVDFSRRTLDSGYNIEFCPEARAIHQDLRYSQVGNVVLRSGETRSGPASLSEGQHRSNAKVAVRRPRWAGKKVDKTLGVIMIVKDEAANLPDLFATIADVADEVVVVDTGSTDGTLAICKDWGVTLLQDKWHNDFSRARNKCIQAATAKHLLWLDGDDRLPLATQAALRSLRDNDLTESRNRAYELVVQNTSGTGAVDNSFAQIRIFPRLPAIRFCNPIHEEIGSSLEAAGIELVKSSICITHTGYADLETVTVKARRNIEMLRLALASDRTNLHYLVHLALAFGDVGEADSAERVLTEAITQLISEADRPTLLAELFVVRARLRQAMGKSVSAAYDLRKASEAWPDWAVPDAVLADYQAQGEGWEDAGKSVSRAESKEFVRGTIGFPIERMRSSLKFIEGYIHIRRAEPEQAIAPLRQCLAMDAGNLNARLALGQILLENGEFLEARDILEPAGADENAIDRFVDVSAAIGLARAMTGDEGGAQACLAPLLTVFSEELAGATEVGPMELAEVFVNAGYGNAAKNMVLLFQHTSMAA